MADHRLSVTGIDLEAAVCHPSFLVINVIFYPSQPLGMVTALEGPPGLMCVGFDCPFSTFRHRPQMFHLEAHKRPYCWKNEITYFVIYDGQEPVFTATVYIKSVNALIPIARKHVTVTVGPDFVASTL